MRTRQRIVGLSIAEERNRRIQTWRTFGQCQDAAVRQRPEALENLAHGPVSFCGPLSLQHCAIAMSDQAPVRLKLGRAPALYELAEVKPKTRGDAKRMAWNKQACARPSW